MAHFVRFLIVVLLLIGNSACGNSEPAPKVSALSETSLISCPANIFDKACRFVYEGEFGDAADLLAQHTEEQGNQYCKLA